MRSAVSSAESGGQQHIYMEVDPRCYYDDSGYNEESSDLTSSTNNTCSTDVRQQPHQPVPRTRRAGGGGERRRSRRNPDLELLQAETARPSPRVPRRSPPSEQQVEGSPDAEATAHLVPLEEDEKEGVVFAGAAASRRGRRSRVAK